MFEQRRNRNKFQSAIGFVAVVYHATVRNIRRSHGNPIIGLLLNLVQAVMFVAMFFVMISILGMRQNAVRGDFLLYIMTGIFLFMTHNKTVSSVAGAEPPTSPMLQHAPMNTIVAICAAALSTLYLQVLSMFVVLFIYHTAFTPIEIMDPVGAFGMLLLAWFSGIAVGLLILSIKPWSPFVVGIATTLYQRANMIASGKMFLANTLPGYMLAMFSWNPLFHTIDQCRGFVFLNYNPHFTSISYPVLLSLTLITVGLMGEFFTRKRASLSWNARR